MTNSITMRELQKISAGTIAALPHTVSIRSGSEVVALLVPLKKASPERLRRLDEAWKQEQATRTPEQQAIYDGYLREIGEE